MTEGPRWLPVLILFALLGLVYLGMWRGWRRRARRHNLPPLVAIPDGPDGPDRPDGPDGPDRPGGADRGGAPLLRAEGRYFGTTTAGEWLDRVVARGLGSRSSCRLTLSAAGLDVERPTGSFRVPTAALRGARHDQGIAGKVVPPHGVLVVTWQHGDLLLDSGFRLDSMTGDQHGTATSAREVHPALAAEITALAGEG